MSNIGFGTKYSAFSDLIDMYDNETEYNNETEYKGEISTIDECAVSTFDYEEDSKINNILSYNKNMLTRVASTNEIEQYFRRRHVTYKLISNGTFTPEFCICTNPPIIIHSENYVDGLCYAERINNDGCIVPDYDNSKGGHYKCGKLARENPGICVYSICGVRGGTEMLFWEYNSYGTPIPISCESYEQKILRKVNFTKARRLWE